MASPREDNRASEFIGVLKNEKMKTHVKRDGSQRVLILYEAPIHVQDGEACLATIYEYSGSNTVPDNTYEKNAIWNEAWEANTSVELVYGDVGYTE